MSAFEKSVLWIVVTPVSDQAAPGSIRLVAECGHQCWLAPSGQAAWAARDAAGDVTRSVGTAGELDRRLSEVECHARSAACCPVLEPYRAAPGRPAVDCWGTPRGSSRSSCPIKAKSHAALKGEGL